MRGKQIMMASWRKTCPRSRKKIFQRRASKVQNWLKAPGVCTGSTASLMMSSSSSLEIASVLGDLSFFLLRLWRLEFLAEPSPSMSSQSSSSISRGAVAESGSGVDFLVASEGTLSEPASISLLRFFSILA